MTGVAQGPRRDAMHQQQVDFGAGHPLGEVLRSGASKVLEISRSDGAIPFLFDELDCDFLALLALPLSERSGESSGVLLVAYRRTSETAALSQEDTERLSFLQALSGFASVTIESPGGETFSRRVEAFGVEAVELPCVKALKSGLVMEPGGEDAGVGDFILAEPQSVLLKDAAHRISSDVPVTVYQFNPLEFESRDPGGRNIYSYTNDARPHATWPAERLLPGCGARRQYAPSWA